MENTKQFLEKQGITARISFSDGLTHVVELVKDKLDTITNKEGEQLEGVRYLVKENGEPKSFFTTSVGLLQQLSGKNKGDVVSITLKKGKNPQGAYRSFYEVSDVESEDEIPIIDDEGYESNPDIFE